MEWIEELLEDKVPPYLKKYTDLVDKLPPIVTKEIIKIKNRDKQRNRLIDRMYSQFYVSGAILGDVLQYVRNYYGEKMYLALAIAVPTYYASLVLNFIHRMFKSPKETAEREVKDFVKKLKESFNADGIIGVALKAVEMLPTRRNVGKFAAEYIAEAFKSSGGKDIPEIVEVVCNPLEECSTILDAYEGTACRIGVATRVLTTYLSELSADIATAENRVDLLVDSVYVAVKGVFTVAFVSGLYGKEQVDELKQKLSAIAPAVFDFLNETVEFNEEFYEVLETLSDMVKETPPPPQEQAVQPSALVPSPNEQASHYIGLAIDSLEQAEKKLKSISRAYKGFAIFILIVYLGLCVYLTSLAASTLWSPPKSILDYIVLYLEMIFLGPLFVGIFFWAVIVWFLVTGMRYSHRAKIVRRNVDALRNMRPEAFSPSMLNVISAELKAASFHSGALAFKTLEASHSIEDALYYLQKAAELMSQQQQ